MKNTFLKFVQLQTWKIFTLTELKINECFEPQVSNFKKIFLDNHGSIKKVNETKARVFWLQIDIKIIFIRVAAFSQIWFQAATSN